MHRPDGLRVVSAGYGLTLDQWRRIDQVRELVKQEGDARCEAAFDDLAAAHTRLSAVLDAQGEQIADLHAKLTAQAAEVADLERQVATWKMHAYDHGYQP